jgi:hypothetical protein
MDKSNAPQSSKFREGLVNHLRGTIAKHDAEQRQADERKHRIESFAAEFLEVAKRIIKPQMDDAAKNLNELKFEAKSEILEKIYGGSDENWPLASFKFRNKQDTQQWPHAIGADRGVSFICRRSKLTVEVSTITGVGGQNHDITRWG